MRNAAEEYGRALFMLAEETGDGALERDAATARDALAAEPCYLRLLDTPSVPEAEKRAAVEAAFVGGHPYLLHTLYLLIERGRGGEALAVLDVFLRLAREARGEALATVETAMPLTEAERAALTDVLSRRSRKTVTLREVVDSRLIGGVRVYLDGQLFDGTYRRRLDGIGERLADTVL